jgi:hypothetical protein
MRHFYRKYYQAFFGIDGGKNKLFNDYNKLINVKITDLYNSGTRSKTTTTIPANILLLDEMFKFIIVIDFIVNNVKYNGNRPQTISLLGYLYSPNLTNDWIANPPNPKNFEINMRVERKFRIIIDTITKLTSAPDKIMFKSDKIKKLIQSGELFFIQKTDSVYSFYRNPASAWIVDEPTVGGKIKKNKKTIKSKKLNHL